MIDVHQNAALSESFEGDRSRVIGNHSKTCWKKFLISESSDSAIFVLGFE